METVVDVDCYWKDYDNGWWDHEEKRYLVLDEENIVERHRMVYQVNIEVVNNDEIKINSFVLLLDRGTLIDTNMEDDGIVSVNNHESKNYAKNLNMRNVDDDYS